ncbi:MAG: hypothetical protein ACOYOQ_00555 [Microthrixaceae bacterium]
MKEWTGPVPERGARNGLNNRVWKAVQDGPVLVSVGDDFADWDDADNWRQSVSSGILRRSAMKEGMKVHTRKVDEGYVVWLASA